MREQARTRDVDRILTAVKAAFLRGLLAVSAVLVVALTSGGAARAATPRVLAVEFENDVNPVTTGYLTGEIDHANSGGYDAVAILMDTPGGLSESMRKIVKVELASKVPVIVYVSPNGARAASAGVWIGQAADILAMAPVTNIGSSTPISLGGTNIQSDLRRKVVNDAAASLVALAASHHRNASAHQPCPGPDTSAVGSGTAPHHLPRSCGTGPSPRPPPCLTDRRSRQGAP